MKQYSLKNKKYIFIVRVIDFIGRLIFRYKRNQSCNDYRNILIFRCDHLGDVILSTPLFSSLKNIKSVFSLMNKNLLKSGVRSFAFSR